MAVDREKDFVAGRRLAYRERVHSWGTPVRPVEFVKNGPVHSKKVRIRWLDGEYKGIEEWVPAVRLVVPWEESEAFLQDEQRNLEALEASEGTLDRITWDAVVTVLYSLVKTLPAFGDEGKQISVDFQ